MGVMNTDIQKLDVNYILSHGKSISSQEALSDVTPVEWDEDVLSGKKKDKTIIKSANGKDKWDV